MAISLGDAVLIFKGDQADLDAAFSSVPDKAKKSFGDAAGYVDAFNKQLDATGDNVAYAGDKVMSLTEAFRTLGVQGPDRLKAKLDDAINAFDTLKASGVDAQGTLLQATIKVTEREIAYKKAVGDSTAELQKRLAALSDSYAKLGSGDATDKIEGGLEDVNKVAEEVAKTIGIDIPKGVTNFVAGMGNAKGAISAAFAPTALVAFAAAIVEITQKVLEYEEKQKELARGMELFRTEGDEHLRDVQDKIDSLGSHVVTLTQGPLAGLRDAFEHMRSSADETFNAISTRIDGVVEQMSRMGTLGLGANALLSPEIVKATNNLKDFRVTLAETMDAAQLAHPENTLLPYQNALKAVQAQLNTVNKLIQDQINTGLSTPKTLEGWEAEVRALNNINVELLRGQKLQEARNDAAQKDISGQQAQQQAEQAKIALDQQLADIEKWRAAQHLAFANNQLDAAQWAAAQVRAADMATVAHEDYLTKLVLVYKEAGNTFEANRTAQELAIERTHDAAKATDDLATAERAQHEANLKVLIDWNNMIARNVAKTFEEAAKSAGKLEQGENRLLKAQEALAEAKEMGRFEKQLEEVQALADAGVIDETEAFNRTQKIYELEEAAQLTHLQTLKDQQVATAAEIKQKIEAMGGAENPFFNQRQMDDLQKNLDRAEAAIVETETKIEQARTGAESKTFGLERNFLKQATSSWDGFFNALIHRSLTAGQALKTFSQLTAEAIGSSVEAAVMGSKSFGAAMQDMLKSMLAAEAGKATMRALDELAEGFSALASPLPGIQHTAPLHFKAAAEWGAVAAASAILGSIIPSSSSTTSAGGGNVAPANLPASPATTANPSLPQPPTTVIAGSVIHLAKGGLVTGPTLAIVGDSIRSSTGPADEAVLPLDNPQAMQQIAGALAEHMPSAGVVNNFHFKGDLVDYAQLMKRQSRMVKKGFARQTVNESMRVIRRS